MTRKRKNLDNFYENENNNKNNNKRIEKQQMGFGTIQTNRLKEYLQNLQERQLLTSKELFLDIGHNIFSLSFSFSLYFQIDFIILGAGIGNVLEEISTIYDVWGVEMNIELKNMTPLEWQSSIQWCKLEDINNDNDNDLRLLETTIAYMYDLCLKRITRKCKLITQNPHWSIQNILLDSNRMPSLRYFISTYEEKYMFHLHGNCWKLIEEKRFPCSTNTYVFYLYERVIDEEEKCKKECSDNHVDIVDKQDNENEDV